MSGTAWSVPKLGFLLRFDMFLGVNSFFPLLKTHIVASLLSSGSCVMTLPYAEALKVSKSEIQFKDKY